MALQNTVRTLGVCLSYNGCCMQDCTVEEFDSKVHYDEQGHFEYVVTTITVSSMIVSVADSPYDAGLANLTNTESKGRANPVQILHGGMQGQNLGLTSDFMAKIHSLLTKPGDDLCVWINDVTAHINTLGFVSDANIKSPVEHHLASRQAGKHRRFLFCACGIAGQDDYVNGATARGGNVTIFDPSEDLTQVVYSTVQRRFVLHAGPGQGPLPLSVSFEPMAGGRVIKTTFTIRAQRLFNDFNEGNSAPYGEKGGNDLALQTALSPSVKLPIMHNRWSVTDSEDADGRVTHTIAGKLRVRDVRNKPNSMRLMAFPLAFPFAKLAERKYMVSPDGKTLAYSFSYTHAGSSPPPGVRDYKAHYVEQFSQHVPGMMFGMMDINVKGWYHRSTNDPTITVTEQTQKRILLMQALTILKSRITFSILHQQKVAPLDPDNAVKTVHLLDMQVIEPVGLPELTLRVKVKFGDDQQQGMADTFLRLKNLGNPFFSGVPQNISKYDPMWWPIDNEFGRLLNFDNSQPLWGFSGFHATEAAWKPFSDYFNNSEKGEFPLDRKTRQKLPIVVTRDQNNNLDGYSDGAKDGDNVLVGTASEQELPNPIPTVAFEAIVSVALNNDINETPEAGPQQTYLSDVYHPDQLRGNFSYVTYETEILSDSATGVVMMPLSAPRDIFGGATQPTSSGSGSSSSYVSAQETATAVRLFAGNGKRVINVKAERINAWPIMPVPAEQLVISDALNGQSQGDPLDVVRYEQLIRKEIIDDAPQPFLSGNGLVFTTNMKLTYGMSRPWSPTIQQTGYPQADEIFPYIRNLILKDDAVQNVASRPTSNVRFRETLIT